MPAHLKTDDRDWIGYGRAGFDPQWPGDAYVAVQFVLNYEEGGERNILDGDETSEARLSEIIGAQPHIGQRNRSIESLFEYGSRAGFWRIWRLFKQEGIPVTVFGVTDALRRNPEAVSAMLETDWEIACHGLRWLQYRDVPEDVEQAHMEEAIRLHTKLTGSRPLGWYTGAQSERTTSLVRREGEFLYSSDSYADDLPYWIEDDVGKHLFVPYAFDTNDVKFVTQQGFNNGDQFFSYLRDTFDTFYAEGKAGSPKMMSVGLHCRIAGHAGRTAALGRFLKYVGTHKRVWLAKRVDIARHWHDVSAP